MKIFKSQRLPGCAAEFSKVDGPAWSIDARGNFYTADRVAGVADQDDVTMAVLRRLNWIPEKAPGWS